MEAKKHDLRLEEMFSSLTKDLNAKPLDKLCPRDVASITRLSKRCAKRAAFARPKLSQKAKAAFVTLNRSVGYVVPSLDSDIVANARMFIVTSLERYTSCLGSPWVQCSLDLNFLLDMWRFGPGASQGVRGTHTCEKVGVAMTCTPRAVPLLKRLRANNTYFRVFDLLGNGIDEVPGSRLETVPKNAETMRTIAIEPSGNMCLQLAAGAYLEGSLRSIGLDIRKQADLNNLLAKRGSIDGSLATIDLSSASDMFTPALIALLFPKEWSELFDQIRSPQIEVNGRYESLNMISTMGNGFTFPLMTYCLVALIYAMRCRGEKSPRLRIDWTHTGVFGDDIIVPSTEYDELCDIIASAGLVVNHDKSFKNGPFRESCGGDYYEGSVITPFYVEDLHDDSRVYVAINKVLDWSVREDIFLSLTIRYLLTCLKGRPLLVPEWESPESGILTSECPTKYIYLKRHVRRVNYPTTPLANHFAVMLIAGGYMDSAGDASTFTPRPRLRDRKEALVARKGKLPKGYLSGWDPLKGSELKSKSRALLINLLVS